MHPETGSHATGNLSGLITGPHSTTLRYVVPTDALDPMEELRRFGIDARVAWYADLDGDALVLVEPDREKPDTPGRLQTRPPRLIPEH